MAETLEKTKEKVMEEIRKKLLSAKNAETNPVVVIYFFEDDKDTPYKKGEGKVEELINGIKQTDFRGEKCIFEIHYFAGQKRLVTIVTITKSK